MKKALVFQGPPLGGKSTTAIEMGVPRFSVRHFFEKRRDELKLPPAGTFLKDEMVEEAADLFIKENANEELIVFDGFPGNAHQLKWLEARLKPEYETYFRYFDIDKQTARMRMAERKVCFNCDGGADPVQGETYCPVCGSPLSKRTDDNPDSFEKRWTNYFQRERDMCSAEIEAFNAAVLRQTGSRRMDLHMHTTYSDGTYSPKELIEKINEAGIKLFAVTDHDTTGAVAECENLAIRHGLDFIKAIEINALYENKEVHILGYGVSPDDPELTEVLRLNMEAKNAHAHNTLALIEASGIASLADKEKYDSYTYDKKRGGWKLLNYLIDTKVCKDGYEYFALLKKLKTEVIEYQPAQKVVDAIKRTGICILAHPAAYNGKFELGRILNDFKNMGVDGIEVFHPLHSVEGMLEINEFCRKHSLIRTGGSDFHGNLPDRILGEPEIYAELIKGSVLENKINK